MHSTNSSNLGLSSYSSAMKKDILWNVVEPGDPYDIRKSMIAKLPGSRKNFMGSHLEIVCLLQSAEIERLCEFLDDYKYRYREIERRELDRHSYEIQIKQLTQQLQDETSFQSENTKLKDFIKRQSVELEELRSTNRDMDLNLRNNYQNALLQIQNLLNQNRNYKLQIENYLIQVNSFNARIEAVQKAKNKQIQQLLLRVNEESRYSVEYETSAIKTKFESEINRLEFELKRLKEFNDAKNQEINELSSKNRNLLLEIQELSSQRTDTSHYERRIQEYQSRFLNFGQEIERLNVRLKDMTSKLDESSRNELLWQEKYSRMEKDVRDVEERYRLISQDYNVAQSKILSLEEEKLKITKTHYDEMSIKNLNTQVDRLNQRLRLEIEEKNRLQNQFSKLSYELNRVSIIEKQNQKYRQSLGENEDNKRRIAEFQNKVALLSQEIQRLNFLLKNADAEKEQYAKLRIEYDESRRLTQNLEFSLTQKYQRQMQQIRADYEQKISHVSQTTGTQFENRIIVMNREMQRLNEYLKQKSEESETYRRKVFELENLIQNKYQIQTNRRYTQYEATIRDLRVETEELNKRSQELNELRRRQAQYENRILMITQDLERANVNYRNKSQQAEMTRKQLRDLELKVTNIYQIQSSRKYTAYEQNINQLSRQNEDLRRKLNELVELNRKLVEYENKFAIMTQQIQRLNHVLRGKVEQIQQYDNRLRNLTLEFQKMNRNKLEVQNNLSHQMEIQKMENSRKVTTFQQNITFLQRQNENIKRIVQEIPELNRRIAEYQSKISLLSQEIERRGQENSELTRRIYEYENKFGAINQELEVRLRQIPQLNRRIVEYENKLALTSQQLQRRSQEVAQLNRRIYEYENSMGQMKQELDRRAYEAPELNRRIAEYENKVALMGQQIERLNQTISIKVNEANQTEMHFVNLKNEFENSRREIDSHRRELDNSRRQYKDLQISLTQKYDIENKKNASIYEQNMNSLTRQLEDHKRKLVEYENVFRKMEVQIERLNTTLKAQIEELNQSEQRYRGLSQEYESTIKKFKEYQTGVINKFENEVSRNYSNFQQTINQLTRQLEDSKRKIMEYQNRITLLAQENERLNQTIRQKGGETENLQRKITEFESLITHKYEGEYSRKIVTYEQNMNNLASENENIRKKIIEYETILNNLTREKEDLIRANNELNQLHKKRNNQINDMNRKFGELETVIVRLQKDNEYLKTDFQNKMHQMSMESDNWKRKHQQLEVAVTQKYEVETSRKITNYEQNIRNMTEEIENLNRKMRNYNIMEQNIAALKNENETLKRHVDERKDEMNRKIAEYQNKIAITTQEIERLNQVLKTKMDESKHYQGEVHKYANEIENVKSSMSIHYKTELDKQNIILAQRKEQIQHISHQYQILQQRLAEMQANKSSEYRQLENSYNLVTKQYENSKKHLIEYEQSIKKLYSEFERLQIIINELKQERQSLYEKNHGLSNEIERLNLEFKSQEEQIYELRLKLADESALQKRINEHMALMVVLFAEIQTLRRRVKDKEKEVEEVRRSSLAPFKVQNKLA